MAPNARFHFQAACIACGTAVALGAFASHGLKARLEPDLLVIFEVGVRYQFYHGLALLACSLAPANLWDSPWFPRAAWNWIAGILVFSGSLYLLAVTGQRWLGAITPIGGVAFLIGWACALQASRRL
ncbi:MAG: DUF423 domain-containing protein [Candidatus Hydrogenedentes bacterium]|nr:DUF423 domain-containing protein [Candidatus Hydrogenedentota bacterium]